MPDEDLKVSDLITLKEAAEYSGFSHNYLRKLVIRGRLKARKLGRQWLTTKEALDRFIRSRQRKGLYRKDIEP